MKNILILALLFSCINASALFGITTEEPLVEISIDNNSSIVVDIEDYRMLLDTTKSIVKSECELNISQCQSRAIEKLKLELLRNVDYQRMSNDQGEGGWSFEGKVVRDIHMSQEIILDISLENFEIAPEHIIQAILKQVQKDL